MNGYIYAYIRSINTYFGVEDLNVGPSLRYIFDFALKWEAKIKLNVNLRIKDSLCLFKSFRAVFTLCFIFLITEAPKDILFKMLLSFWLAEREVQHGLFILWLVNKAADLISCLVP